MPVESEHSDTSVDRKARQGRTLEIACTLEIARSLVELAQRRGSQGRISLGLPSFGGQRRGFRFFEFALESAIQIVSGKIKNLALQLLRNAKDRVGSIKSMAADSSNKPLASRSTIITPGACRLSFKD